MPLTKEQHEELLNKLANPELSQTERTDILQQLRVDYGGVLTDFSSLTEKQEKLQSQVEDLVVSNSQLFRQLGIVGETSLKEKEEEKTFSETVTLESLGI